MQLERALIKLVRALIPLVRTLYIWVSVNLAYQRKQMTIISVSLFLKNK